MAKKISKDTITQKRPKFDYEIIATIIASWKTTTFPITKFTLNEKLCLIIRN